MTRGVVLAYTMNHQPSYFYGSYKVYNERIFTLYYERRTEMKIIIVGMIIGVIMMLMGCANNEAPEIVWECVDENGEINEVILEDEYLEEIILEEEILEGIVIEEEISEEEPWVSDEYLEELAYNSQGNIYWGS